MDLFEPLRTTSLGGKSYAFLLWMTSLDSHGFCILAHKNDAFLKFSKLCRKVQNEKSFTFSCIRSDYEREFENIDFEGFCDKHEIEHNFLAPRIPQQNEVVERKNRTLQEMARIMLHENNLPTYFWAEVTNTYCYILNRVLIRPSLDKTPYELWKNKKPNINYFQVFRSKFFILNIMKQPWKI